MIKRFLFLASSAIAEKFSFASENCRLRCGYLPFNDFLVGFENGSSVERLPISMIGTEGRRFPAYRRKRFPPCSPDWREPPIRRDTCRLKRPILRRSTTSLPRLWRNLELRRMFSDGINAKSLHHSSCREVYATGVQE